MDKYNNSNKQRKAEWKRPFRVVPSHAYQLQISCSF